MLALLKRVYGYLVTSGSQLLLLLVGHQLDSRTGWLWCLGAIALFSLLAWHSELYRLRMVSGMPTSRIGSAAQGYVQLLGRGKLNDPPLTSKLREQPCLWYSWEVEERDSDNDWMTRDRGESTAPFLLDDGSGICLVDPKPAVIHTKHCDKWTEGSYRYTEQWLSQEDSIHVIGQFKTVGGSNIETTHKQLVKDVLAEWKMDKQELMRRFDLDNNGVLDSQEWELARSAAEREAKKRLNELCARPETNFMLKPHDGRPYLISNLKQNKLTSRYKWKLLFNLLTLFGALAVLGFMLQYPPL